MAQGLAYLSFSDYPLQTTFSDPQMGAGLSVVCPQLRRNCLDKVEINKLSTMPATPRKSGTLESGLGEFLSRKEEDILRAHLLERMPGLRQAKAGRRKVFIRVSGDKGKR